jgi:predicted nucleic acid-binding protein
MILADTSVWVEHFRRGLPLLAAHLTQAQIAIHSVVLGELATIFP